MSNRGVIEVSKSNTDQIVQLSSTNFRCFVFYIPQISTYVSTSDDHGTNTRAIAIPDSNLAVFLDGRESVFVVSGGHAATACIPFFWEHVVEMKALVVLVGDGELLSFDNAGYAHTKLPLGEFYKLDSAGSHSIKLVSESGDIKILNEQELIPSDHSYQF